MNIKEKRNDWNNRIYFRMLPRISHSIDDVCSLSFRMGTHVSAGTHRTREKGGEMEKLDTNTLVYIIDYIQKRLDEENAMQAKWNGYNDYNQERISTLEDVLKYMKYLHTMSLDISL